MMVNSRDRPPDQILDSLEDYVIAPLRRADGTIETERSELVAERDEFAAFIDRVGEIAPSPVSASIHSAPAVVDRQTQHTPENAARIRSAYRETVMNVEHYDRVYGEPLLENISVELGPDFAVALAQESTVSITQSKQRALQTAARQAAREREQFIDTLDREAASLESVRTDLSECIDQIHTSVEMKGTREPVREVLERVSERRQTTLDGLSAPPGHIGHSLCEYLYADLPWTYPALSAIARFRTSMLVSPDG